MKFASQLRLAAIAAPFLLVSAAAAAGPTRSADSLPALPAQSSNASDKSQGLPKADGGKPGKGEGKGHQNSKGRGHEIGKGHGHNDDRPASPG